MQPLTFFDFELDTWKTFRIDMFNYHKHVEDEN